MTGLDATQLPAAIELCSYLSFHWAVRSSNDPGLDLISEYLKSSGANLTWSVDEKSGRPKRFQLSTVLAFCDQAIRGKRFAANEYSSGIWLGVYGGKDKAGASPWTLTGGFQMSTTGSLLLLTWPLHTSPSWRELAAVVSRAADDTLRLAHGGLTYAHSVFGAPDGATRHAVVPRFWGVDPPETKEDAYASVDGTRCPSWLTFVPVEKLSRLSVGTLERLDPAIVQTKLSDGTLFQLGPEPVLGDQNRGEAMPLHRELARALKPIRGDLTHWTNSTSYNYPTWVARFDAPETELTP